MRTSVLLEEVGQLVAGRHENPFEILGPHEVEASGRQAMAVRVDSQAGWFCYLMKNDLMSIKRFDIYPKRIYNEMAALTISIWYNKDIMCELEPIGPMQTLKPGQSAAFTEEWWLTPYEFPGDRTKVNLKKVSKIADMAMKGSEGF